MYGNRPVQHNGSLIHHYVAKIANEMIRYAYSYNYSFKMANLKFKV